MSLEYPDEDTVAIFWDYENCEIPGAADASSITRGIRRIAHEYGAVTSFRAYLEVSELYSPRAVLARTTLQDCGVSLIDCPHNGRKEVADKMILGS
ncbi:hypothetical protein NM688_g1942 [Phlebia brevispora]|uniref:Uncharacterized protein n=1 Tax=Phlebia brevispora TaxID=194682 RepID=A0ACC1TAA2_9APHY|nr:hypothetical protein NM688_g1942 [Phlebia brevispora]